MVDITMFSGTDCIGHDLIRDFIIQTSIPKPKLARNPFVKNNHRLRKLGILQFTWEKCMEMLQSNYFLSKFTPEMNIIFISYLYNKRSTTQIQKRLHELPIIMDQSGYLRRVMDVYFPSRFNSADWHMFESNDAYVHQHILEWLETETSIKNWLRKLGIQEKTDMTFVEQYIIPRARHYINQDNAIITMKRLFILFQHGMLTTHHIHELRKLKLWTGGGTLVPAHQLYFPTDYSPHLPIDFLELDQSLFLSPVYLPMIQEISIQQLKYFFQSLGVHENICLTPIDEDWYSELVSAYYAAHTLNMPSYMNFGFKNRMTILHIELTQSNYDFAVFFWDHVIRTINVNRLNEPEILLGQRRISIHNLPQWCVRTRFCIPTTTGELRPSIEVFSSNLKAIAGKYLPVFNCDARNILADGWQTFFGFKRDLSIDDCFILLDHIYCQSQRTTLDDDEERRIQLIYTTLMNLISRMDQTSLNRWKIKKPFYLLSTYENQFKLATDLIFSNDTSITLPNRIAQLRLNHENSSNVHLNKLLEVLNVRRVTINDLVLSSTTDARQAHSLQTKLRNIQSYLFALAEFRKLENHCIDYNFEIFEADRIELCYEQDIPICQKPIHLYHNHLYIKRPWNSDETIEILCEVLCKQLKLPSDFEPDLRLMLTAESMKIIDEHFSEQNITVQNRLLDNLLTVTGPTREKFAAAIDRDNAKLFSHLNIAPSTSAAEVLLVGLEAQESRWSGYVYHFTHLENAATILHERLLKARGQLSINHFKDSAAGNVIKTTRTIVKDYVRFYFRPLTPTQRCNENLGVGNLIEQYGNRPMCPVPIFFRFNLRSLLNIKSLRWKVSLGNMASSHTSFDCTRDIIDKFDYQYVYADTRTERGKFSSQHEFLIESQLDFNQLTPNDIQLVFQDENALTSLKSMMVNLEYSAEIDSSFFLGYNPRVIIEQVNIHPKKIIVKVDRKDEPADNSQLIVQIISEEHVLKTITGNLVGVFIRDNELTILGKERISFVSEVENLKYAVYYKYLKQLWLIHTSYLNPEYKIPNKDLE